MILIVPSVRTQSLRWSALEVLNGSAPTIKSDVWSFAVVTWEIFSDTTTLYDGGLSHMLSTL